MSRPPKPEPAATWEPTGSLVPWAKNPRLNDGRPVDEVAASMERFGFTAPILARVGTREIIAGHTRWKAAQKIGLDRVAVRFLDVTDDEAHAIALADNRLGELAGWDDDLLREVLADLQAGAVDLDGLGWTAEELEGVMEGSAKKDTAIRDWSDNALISPTRIVVVVDAPHTARDAVERAVRAAANTEKTRAFLAYKDGGASAYPQLGD